jgi:hypothetical protein
MKSPYRLLKELVFIFSAIGVVVTFAIIMLCICYSFISAIQFILNL